MVVEKFIEVGSIDPLYFDESYDLTPDAKAGEDVCAVLREAVAKTGKIALASLRVAPDHLGFADILHMAPF